LAYLEFRTQTVGYNTHTFIYHRRYLILAVDINNGQRGEMTPKRNFFPYFAQYIGLHCQFGRNGKQPKLF